MASQDFMPEPRLGELDWEAIREAVEAARLERAATGKPGTTILEINEPAPSARDRRPVHRIWIRTPADKR